MLTFSAHLLKKRKAGLSQKHSGLQSWLMLMFIAHLLKKEKLGGVQAKVVVLGEMILGGCICGRTGHDIPPDWMPA